MITNIYLVRHAHSDYSKDELNRPLSERGLKAAEKITAILSEKSIDLVIASPYKRAIQTVEGTSKAIGKEIEIEENFKERKISDGYVEDFEGTMKKLWTNEEFSFSGGESNKVAQKRGIKALNKVLDQYCGRNIAIGTHGNIMVLMMNYFDKSYDYTFWRKLKMPDIYKLSFNGRAFIGAEGIWKE